MKGKATRRWPVLFVILAILTILGLFLVAELRRSRIQDRVRTPTVRASS